MHHIGIDVPKRESQIRILAKGELIEPRIRAEPEQARVTQDPTLGRARRPQARGTADGLRCELHRPRRANEARRALS